MKTHSHIILSIYLLVFIGTSNAFSQVENSILENPVEYFNKRTEAISLVKSANWQELIPVLERLTLQYQNDGDLFYLLALSYYQIDQYQKAVAPLKQTLDLGGTILTGIPRGSAPSNDITASTTSDRFNK